MMGCLDSDNIEVQAQYNWVVKANCTESFHLLQRGDYCNYWYLKVNLFNIVDIPDITAKSMHFSSGLL